MPTKHSANYYRYKPIVENPILLDFSTVRHYDEFHQLLKEKFGLPDYYGMNADALWDCLSVRWSENEPITVELHGVFSVCADLQKQMELALDVFHDVHEECPFVQFVIKS